MDDINEIHFRKVPTYEEIFNQINLEASYYKEVEDNLNYNYKLMIQYLKDIGKLDE